MIYTIEKAHLISEHLKRFTTGHAHYVAGQFANIDFWLQEVKDALKTIDGYNKRFNSMRDVHNKWIESTEPYEDKEAIESYEALPIHRAPLVRVSHNELEAARKDLTDATYFFLLRCYRMRLLDKNTLEIKCNEIGTSIDPSDLEK